MTTQPSCLSWLQCRLGRSQFQQLRGIFLLMRRFLVSYFIWVHRNFNDSVMDMSLFGSLGMWPALVICVPVLSRLLLTAQFTCSRHWVSMPLQRGGIWCVCVCVCCLLTCRCTCVPAEPLLAVKALYRWRNTWGKGLIPGGASCTVG